MVLIVDKYWWFIGENIRTSLNLKRGDFLFSCTSYIHVSVCFQSQSIMRLYGTDTHPNWFFLNWRAIWFCSYLCICAGKLIQTIYNYMYIYNAESERFVNRQDSSVLVDHPIDSGFFKRISAHAISNGRLAKTVWCANIQ